MSSKKKLRKAKASRERNLKNRLTEQELITDRLRSVGVDMAKRANHAIGWYRQRAITWKSLAKKYRAELQELRSGQK